MGQSCRGLQQIMQQQLEHNAMTINAKDAEIRKLKDAKVSEVPGHLLTQLHLIFNVL